VTRPALLEIAPAVEHALLDLVRAGLPLTIAARELGVGERTAFRWKAKGLAGEPVYARFALGLVDAETERAHDVAELVAIARRRCRRAL
jgi:hypothetical protein